MLGYTLVIVGGIFLLKNLGILGMIDWDLIWPIVLIVVGFLMIYKKKI
jgi:hypothetical protein